MEQYDVDRLYREEHFKEGNSRNVDEAIAALLDIMRRERFSGRDFDVAWQEFLKTLLSDFPNISIHNLAALHLPFIVHGLHPENLVVYRFIVQLGPQSSESQCFLGHAYRDIGDLESAAVCYQLAFSLQMRFITERNLKQDNPEYLDACDYLCFLANAENELRRRADALVHATEALSMLKNTNAVRNQSKVYKMLHKIFLGMDLPDLAETFHKTLRQ